LKTGQADPALGLTASEAQREAETHLAEAEGEVDERRRGVEKAARDREVWRREVADLERQLDYARDEAQKAERRVTDAKEALGLSEQRMRAAKVRLDRKNSGLSG